MEKFQTKLTDNLFHAVLSLKSVEECYKFFEDVCTIKEIQEIAGGRAAFKRGKGL